MKPMPCCCGQRCEDDWTLPAGPQPLSQLVHTELFPCWLGTSFRLLTRTRTKRDTLPSSQPAAFLPTRHTLSKGSSTRPLPASLENHEGGTGHQLEGTHFAQAQESTVQVLGPQPPAF